LVRKIYWRLGPDFRAGLQPYIRLLAVQYPVDDWRIQVNGISDERGLASNAALKQKRGHLTRHLTRSRPQPVFLAVHRRNFMVYYRRIEAEEYRLLGALRAGHTIAGAIDRVDHGADFRSGKDFGGCGSGGTDVRPPSLSDGH
jgi:hypothetical protein